MYCVIKELLMSLKTNNDIFLTLKAPITTAAYNDIFVTLKAPITTAAVLNIFSLFFKSNTCYFM